MISGVNAPPYRTTCRSTSLQKSAMPRRYGRAMFSSSSHLRTACAEGPNDSMLDPWRLKLLGDLAALGTVRAVAQAAHLSPSTVSQQLATLERETGARLFERSGRRLHLT